MKLDISKFINKNILNILQKINKTGGTAYIVGGAVRDILLGNEPMDFDIASSLLPNEVSKTFDKVILTGAKYGTVTVITENAHVEITTFRTENKYSDHRHPDTVEFSKDINTDLKRRDFTINAMALSISGDIIDNYNGIEDLNNRIIKAVGNPEERFKEDALRKLRAVRFAAVIDGEIEKHTYNAILENPSIQGVSIERVREEFNKILLSKNPSKGIKLLFELNLLQQFIPEFSKTYGFEQKNPYHAFDVFHHIIQVVDKTTPKLEVRLAAFFHDIGKPDCFTIDEKGIGHFYGHYKLSYQICLKILKRMKYSKFQIKLITTLVKEHHSMPKDIKQSGIKRVISRVGKENMEYLFDLLRADRLAKKKHFTTEDIEEKYKIYQEIIKNNEPTNIEDLEIDGSDLIDIGFTGVAIKEQLNLLLNHVIEDKTLNTKNNLLRIATENKADK